MGTIDTFLNPKDAERLYTIAGGKPKDRLTVDEPIAVGQCLVSQNSKYILVFDRSGKLVLFEEGTGPIWASNDLMTGASKGILRDNGIFELVDDGNRQWATRNINFPRKFPEAIFLVQDEGNVIVRYSASPKGPVFWSALAKARNPLPPAAQASAGSASAAPATSTPTTTTASPAQGSTVSTPTAPATSTPRTTAASTAQGSAGSGPAPPATTRPSTGPTTTQAKEGSASAVTPSA